MSGTSEAETSTTAEVEALRARISELEARLIETEDWANRAVGAAQERVYWLDRWHVDLNALMQRRSATWIRAVLRAIRSVYRLLMATKQRLRSAP
ncbi:MAG TPA: hypothetical protein VG365_05410 [Solirubrobacteraceae bacterium]|jgi:hypothetical protein|nr:hypothetical protein [Solirubrobacteraceae bacterium]